MILISKLMMKDLIHHLCISHQESHRSIENRLKLKYMQNNIKIGKNT
jgi:hypothetical protein